MKIKVAYRPRDTCRAAERDGPHRLSEVTPHVQTPSTVCASYCSRCQNFKARPLSIRLE